MERWFDTLRLYEDAMERTRGRVAQVQSSLESARSRSAEHSSRLITLQKAQVILQLVALKTQEELSFRVSELATMALRSIFPKPYELRVRFEQKRGRTEAVLSFVLGEEEVNPLTASGGGAVDVAAFALRISLSTLKRPPCRPIFLFDEAFRNVSVNYKPAVSAMVREVCERLGLQMIIVTHETTLVKRANNVIKIEKEDIRSTATPVEVELE